MHKIVPILLAVCCCAVSRADAQGAPDAIKAVAGEWEISNADREKTCNLTFRTDPAKGGFKVEFEKACAAVFPPTREVEAWTIVKGDLRLLDARGRTVFDFNEVESGMYEAERGAEGLYFLQSHASAAPAARLAQDMLGDWTVARAGRSVCALTLTDRGLGGEGELALRLRPGCDLPFAPASWRMDRGELVLSSANGQSLRFEETEPNMWRRVPESSGGLTISRK